jgi:hypothetical protein
MIILRLAENKPDRPNYEDLNKLLKPFLEREFLLIRIDERSTSHGPKRLDHLHDELIAAEKRVAELNL